MKKLLAIVSFILLLTSCDLYDNSLPEYIDFYTSTAAIESHVLDGSYPAGNDGIVNISPETNRTIFFNLNNPQNYDLNLGINWVNSNISSRALQPPTYGIDYILEQDSNNKSLIRLTFMQPFLMEADKVLDGNISASITLIEPQSQRVFAPYAYSLESNSPPPAPIAPMLMKETTGNNYVICFKLPNFATVQNHQDIQKLRITDKLTRIVIEYTLEPSDIVMGDGAVNNNNGKIIIDTPTLEPWKVGEAALPGDYDIGGHGIFYKTDVTVGDPINYIVTLIDDKGLSSAAVISTVPTVPTVPTEVYLNPNAAAGGIGTEASPVQTIDAAKNLLGSNVSSPATIWIMNTITLATGERVSLDGENGVTVKRYGGNATASPSIPACIGALVNITSGTFALENIIIDGQGGISGGLGGSTRAQSALITVNSGGTLELNSGATLQNNNNTTTNGGGVNITNGGTLTINTGVTINANIATDNGGGVYVNASTFEMKGGTISNNGAIGGGGIYVENNSALFTITGGTIQANTATGNGGGMYVANGTVPMSNVAITDNTAIGDGAGVYLNPNVTALNLSGTLNISGNKKGTNTNNIAYTNGDNNSAVKVIGAISILGKEIGLSPTRLDTSFVVVEKGSSYGGSITPADFSLDGGGNIGLASGTGHLIIQ